MKIEARQLGDVIEPAYEVALECAHCGMPVDDVEYANDTCTDCGNPWQEKRHTAIHVTSVPMAGETI